MFAHDMFTSRHDVMTICLIDGVEIHPVFHVSRLKELLGSGNNTVTTENLLTSKELSSKPHVRGKNLDAKTKKLC